jgi:hypothetical protein
VELMPVPKVSGLNCPNCGGPIELRSFTNALSVVCPQCLSVLDAKDPNLQILQQAQARERVQPLIPLGSRGTLASGTFEVIGFQVRTAVEDGESFSWSEYLLFNPYKGFRYLVEFNGHWNDVRTLNTLPQPAGSDRIKALGSIFWLSSNSMAETSFVLGEFPWQVSVGESVQVTDYVCDTKVLSAETTPEEVVWSMGEYLTGAQVFQAFKLTGQPPAAIGIGQNQPSPFRGTVASIWKTTLQLAAAAVVVAILFYAISGHSPIYTQSVSAGTAVTPPFNVPGHRSNLDLKTVNRTGQSLYVQYSLVSQDNGRTTNFGRQIKSDRSGDEVKIPDVDPGRYYLRVEADGPSGPPDGSFDIELRRNVPSFGWLFGALFLLIVPPIVHSIRALSFNRSRGSSS